MLSVDEVAALVREWKGSADIQLEIRGRIEIDVHPARLPVGPAADVEPLLRGGVEHRVRALHRAQVMLGGVQLLRRYDQDLSRAPWSEETGRPYQNLAEPDGDALN